MPDEPRRRTPISACVICYQESDRIADCLRSLAFCDEILAIDSGSDDGTVEIARAEGADVRINQPFPGHREQKQLCVDQAKYDWVLCLDSDERVTPELRQQIEQLAEAGLDGVGYSMPRRNHYLGKVVRRGLFWPDINLRLFDRRQCHWGGTNPHDKVQLPEGRKAVRLSGAIEHLAFRDFAEHRRTTDSFTRIAAQALFDQGRRFHWFDLLVRPIAVVIKSLILKRGFVDGWRGFVIAGMAFRYDWLKYWRLRALWRQARRERRAKA